MKQLKAHIGIAAALLVFLFFPTIVHAGITNEGKDAVTILATKENGSSQATLYPGQTIPIPENTKSLKVLSPTAARGDEQTKVRIVQPNTVVLYLNKIGDSVNLGEPQPESVQAVEFRKVSNLGNLAVNLIVRKKSGFSDTAAILALQSMILPEDTEEIEVAPMGSVRGDEAVHIEVILLSGATKTLESFGAKVRMDEIEE